MGKTPISPLVWVSALSREFKEVTKPTSRSVASATSAPGTYLSHGSCHIRTVTWRSSVTWQVSHVAIVCQMAVFTWQLSHGSCHMAIVYLMAIICHREILSHMITVCHMAFVSHAGTCLLSIMCMSKRHMALAAFDQARAYLCNSACSKALGICRCKCAWPMYIVQAVWKLS